MGWLSLTVTKESAWQFVTFGSGGVGLGYFAAGGGQVVLKSPSGTDSTFTYGGAGVGLSAGLKIPKLGKVQINTKKGGLTGSVGPMQMPSTGKVFLTDNASGELSESDIRGVCAFTEAGGGLLAGASGVAMYVGMNPFLMAIPVVGPQLFINSAKGIILMAGANIGIQAQVGISGCVGVIG
jgi:hypothetical protein